MKLVVFGGRDFENSQFMADQLDGLYRTRFIYGTPTLICGMARGADIKAYWLFKKAGFDIEEYPADWQAHGRSAGYIRNTEMAQICDAGVGFWDGKSKGTKHMVDIMQRLDKPLMVYKY